MLYFGRLAEFGILLVPVVLSLTAPPTFTLFDFVEVSICFGAVSWLLGSISNVRVVVGDAGLGVVNVFFRCWIPWSAVSSVDADDQVSITLTDGKVIRPLIEASSLIDVIRKNRHQQNTAQVILAHRPQVAASDDVGAIVRANKYPWLFLLPTSFLLIDTVIVFVVRH